jgi:succinoglycan biosynthesis protein ExoM
MSQPESSPAELRIDICICTFRRPELADALRSLASLRFPGGWHMRIVVADNDEVPSARELVAKIQPELPFRVAYVHCPAANISIARNACLEAAEGDFLAFLDDDETASPDWLSELVTTAEATGADAVLGPVRAHYRDDAPRWMREGDFHSTSPVWVGGDIRTGYTCNVLLRRGSQRVAGRRFSLARGRSGGEDTEYFTRLHEAGGKIAFAPNAWVHEPVPAARARLSWLARRRFRSGQTHGHLLDGKTTAIGLGKHIALAGAKALYCFAVAGTVVFSPRLRNRYALRGLMHVGVVSGLAGLRELQQYGDVAAKQEAGIGT